MATAVEFRLEKADSVSQPYMWAVYKTSDSTQLAYSETYTQRQGAINAVYAVKSGQCTYETFQGSDGYWYFHIKGLNHQILARSSYKYTYESGAAAAAKLIKDNAGEAGFYDHAKAA